MFNIGIISLSEKEVCQPHIELLEKKYNVHLLNQELLFKEITRLDALIICNSLQDESSKICEWIMKIRTQSSLFIWLLSEQPPLVNRLVYLQLGADVVFEQGMDNEEFVLIISHSLSRLETSKTFKKSKSSLQLDQNKCAIILKNGNEVWLTVKEYKVLDILEQRKGYVVSYEAIYQSVWGGISDDTKLYRVANIVHLLRKKIGQQSEGKNYIKTVRSIGYLLSE